jgi:hypothetical protein
LAAQRRLGVLVTPAATEDAVHAAIDDLADLLTVASVNGLDFDSLDTTGLSDVT